MKCISFEDTHKGRSRLLHHEAINAIVWVGLSLQCQRNYKVIFSQSDFSVKVKGQTSTVRQMEKRTGTGKETTHE